MVDDGFVLNPFRPRAKATRAQRFLGIVRLTGTRDDQTRLGIPPQRIAQQPRQLGIPVRHMRFVFGQRIDDIACSSVSSMRAFVNNRYTHHTRVTLVGITATTTHQLHRKPYRPRGRNKKIYKITTCDLDGQCHIGDT